MARYRLLVVGGSGLVGGLTVPVLARRHQVRVYDLRPPPPGVDYHAGALHHRDGFQAITISGDQAGRFSTPGRARLLLDWPPPAPRAGR